MLILLYVLSGIIIIQQIFHCIERRDLYNRIMSRDLNDYRSNRALSNPTSAHKKVISRWRDNKKE